MNSTCVADSFCGFGEGIGAKCSANIDCNSGCCVSDVCLDAEVCSSSKSIGDSCFWKGECQSGCCFADLCADSSTCQGEIPGGPCTSDLDCFKLYCCGSDGTCTTTNNCEGGLGSTCFSNATCCCVEDTCVLKSICNKNPIGSPCLGRSFCESDCCGTTGTCEATCSYPNFDYPCASNSDCDS